MWHIKCYGSGRRSESPGILLKSEDPALQAIQCCALPIYAGRDKKAKRWRLDHRSYRLSVCHAFGQALEGECCHLWIDCGVEANDSICIQSLTDSIDLGIAGRHLLAFLISVKNASMHHDKC